MSEYKMPSLGADMEDAILIEWKVKEGDSVQNGDIIAEIETVKGDIDVEVFEDGVVEKIIAQPGQKLPVGTVLAYIKTDISSSPKEAPDEQPPKEIPPVEIPPVSDPPPTIPPVEIPSPAPDPIREPSPPEITPVKDPIRKPTPPEVVLPMTSINEKNRPRASPLARKMAQNLGIDLQQIKSSNESGVIHKVDIESFIKNKSKNLKPVIQVKEPQESKKNKMRSAIAAAMSKSNREIPHYYLETSIDMKIALDWLRKENSKRSISDRVLPAALLIKATALALAEVPNLNAYWTNEGLQQKENINIGFTISLRQGGLVIPAIQKANQKTLDVLMEELSDIIQRARTAKLRSSELTTGTVTITNVGERGAEKVFGIIYPPQVALIGFGKIIEKPWAINGLLGIRPVLSVTLAADHRATDGIIGSRFLEKLNQLLQNPHQL